MDSGAYEHELIQRAVAGDTVAITVLLSQLHERLSRHIGHKIPHDLRGTVDADDILQETQVEVYRHIGRFEQRGPDSYYRWVATIAIRRLRNAIRRQRAAKRGGGWASIPTVPAFPEASVATLLELMAGPDDTPSRVAAAHEAAENVQAALALLPDDYRKAVQLVYIEGRSVAETAAEMGRTNRAIHNLCYKAKDHLRGLLGSGSRYFSSWGRGGRSTEQE